MCRMFAFKSRVSLKVQRSLVKAENALQIQSSQHPHGWGIAYYLSGETSPHEVRSVNAAFSDERFRRVSEFLTANAVVAHVRKATVGDLTPENTHPFHWGGWTFCHNGTLFGYSQIKDQLRERLNPRFHDCIVGSTDSEMLFYLVLSALENAGLDVDSPPDIFPDSIDAAVGELLDWLRDLCEGTHADEREAMMNFILTNGRVLIANRYNGTLSFSTQKKRCADYDICPVANKVCFGPRRVGIRHTHVLIASDPTSPDDIWEEVPNRGMVLIDSELRLAVRALPAARRPNTVVT
jgi:predicted glutamine amidotransferase